MSKLSRIFSLDNVDTRSALEAIREFVSNANVYIEGKRATGSAFNRVLLKSSAGYITKIFDMFGLISRPEDIGFPTSQGQAANVEDIAMPFLNAMADFRDNVRKEARETKAVNILKECDRLRDDILPELGVRLEDKVSRDLFHKPRLK